MKSTNSNCVTQHTHSNNIWGFPSYYNFLRKDYILQGNYFSKIAEVKFTNTSSGKSAIDVCYITIDMYSQYRYLNDIIAADEEFDCFFIRQRMSYGSKSYNEFQKYIRNNFGIYTRNQMKKLVGYTELLDITHNTKTHFAYIRKRRPLSSEELRALNI